MKKKMFKNLIHSKEGARMLQTCDKISDDKKIEVSGSIILTQPSYTILARFVVLWASKPVTHVRACFVSETCGVR